MTHPPQPPGPHGQQPPSGGFPGQDPPQGPYGQQPPSGGFPGQQPPSGGFPGQQPGPYGQQPPGYGGPAGYPQHGMPDASAQAGYDPYAQGGFDPYGQGGPGGQPPKKKTGLIVAIIAIVVIGLAALGITGFVAPGFFLAGSDDADNTDTTQTAQPPDTDTDGQPPKPDIVDGDEPGPAPRPGGGGDEAEVSRVAEAVATAFNARDTGGLRDLACDPDTIKEDDFGGIPDDAEMRVTGSPVIDGDSATVELEFSSESEGGTGRSDLPLDKDGARWCADFS